MSSFNQIQTACGALGYFDGKTYLKDDDCEDALRILLRSLKYENERKDARLQMLESKIVENDLVPILIHLNSKNDEKIIHHALKLIVNLTKPPLVCFDGKLPKDVTLTNVYLKIENLLQKTKSSLANEKLFDFLVNKVQPVLDRNWLDRSDDDDFIVHAVFTLVRNILSIKSEREISEQSDINGHDLVLWAIHKSSMENLILFCGNKAQSDERVMNILEIVVFMLREQSAEQLAYTGEQQSKTQQKKNNETLDLLYERQMAEKQQLQKLTTHRSAFGGATYVMCNAKGIGENQLICHKPLQNLNAMEFDREKRRFRRPKHRAPVKSDVDDSEHHRSALGIRLFLREFCLAFLDNCYNIVMPRAREMIMKSTCLLSDETNFFWATKFFTEFNRHAHKSIERISETLQMNTFHLLHTKIDYYREMIKIDKPEAKLWAKRLHIAFNAFKEYILCVKSMLTSTDELTKRAAAIIKNNIFYMQEYREQIYILLRDFDNTKMSSSYLRDLIESTHEFLKMLEEHTTKLKHVFVQRRRTVRKSKSKKKKSESKTKTIEEPNEQLEDEWQNKISENLSRLLQGLEDTTISKSDVCPFDPLSETPVDDQSITAVARIQHALRTNKLDEAIALFRASREVWQTEKTFGYEDIGAEEEFNLLREIFMTTNMDNLLPKNNEDNDDEDNDEEDKFEDGNEHNEDEPESFHTSEREEEFDFKKFIMRFAHSSILSSYIDVIRTYANNTPYLNHCVIRLFYRVTVDCNYPGMLFQMSLFRILQKFHADPLSKLKEYNELLQFGTWLLGKFFSVIKINPYIYAELLFWKDRSIVDDILDGYRQTTTHEKQGESKTKAAAWSIEHQIELRDLYRKIKEEQIENIGTETSDIVDRIMLELTDKIKTRRQIIKELKLQGLIKSVRELKLKKAPRRRSKKNDFLDDSKLRESNSDLSDIHDNDDDNDQSIENKSISSEVGQEEVSNDSNIKTNNIIEKESSKTSEQDDDESLPIITKQSRKYESSTMFIDKNNDHDDDDDDDISTARPIKKARRQLASSSEDDE